jgi:hypothetical protein
MNDWNPATRLNETADSFCHRLAVAGYEPGRAVLAVVVTLCETEHHAERDDYTLGWIPSQKLQKKRANGSEPSIVLFNNCYATLSEVPDHPGSLVIQQSCQHSLGCCTCDDASTAALHGPTLTRPMIQKWLFGEDLAQGSTHCSVLTRRLWRVQSPVPRPFLIVKQRFDMRRPSR